MRAIYSKAQRAAKIDLRVVVVLYLNRKKQHSNSSRENARFECKRFIHPTLYLSDCHPVSLEADPAPESHIYLLTQNATNVYPT